MQGPGQRAARRRALGAGQPRGPATAADPAGTPAGGGRSGAGRRRVRSLRTAASTGPDPVGRPDGRSLAARRRPRRRRRRPGRAPAARRRAASGGRSGLRLGLFGSRSGSSAWSPAGTAGASCSRSDPRSKLGGNLGLVHDRMVERGLDREYELLTLFSRASPRPRACAIACGCRGSSPAPTPSSSTTTSRSSTGWTPGRADRPAVARLGRVQDRRLQPGRQARRPEPVWPRPQELRDRHRQLRGRGAVLRGGVRHPGVARPPDGHPAHGRVLGPGAAGRRSRGRPGGLSGGARPDGVLFAPTFRGDGATTRVVRPGLLDYAALHALCVERDAVCIIRLHPFVRQPLDIPDALARPDHRRRPSPIDINDLLFASDLLITDYSSIVFEYASLDRPMLFYAPDLEEYVAEPRLLRGLRDVRARTDRAHLPGPARRHPPRTTSTRSVGRVPGRPPRPLRRRRHRPGHRPHPRTVARSIATCSSASGPGASAWGSPSAAAGRCAAARPVRHGPRPRADRQPGDAP